MENSEARTTDFEYGPAVVQTCIGFADDPHKTIVREDGSLNYNYEFGPDKEYDPNELGKRVVNSPYAEFPLTSFRHRMKPTFTHEDSLVDRTQTYGDPGEAVVTTREEYENTTFEWTAFAHRSDEGLRADVIRWELETSNDFGRAPTKVRLDLRGPEEDAPPVYKSEPSAAEYLSQQNLPDYAIRRGLNHYNYVESGDTLRGAFVVVREGDLDPETVTVEWADEALDRTREYWRSTEPFRNEFRIPDEQVQAMLESCGRNVLQAREERDGVVEYQVGPTEYRGLWIVDGHFILEAAHMMGRGDEAFEQGLLALLRRVKPSGAIHENPKHMKETGIALATIVRQCELADDDERLRELWPTMRRAREYIESLRAKAEAMGEEYDANELFPPTFLDGGIDGPYPEYTTPLWMMVGLRAASRAGERLDLDGANEFRETYEDVREGFERCAKRDARETESGVRYLPMRMEEHSYDNPQSATWAFAHAIYPGEVFRPGNERVQDFLELLDSIDGKQGLPEGTGWIHNQAIWPYSGAFYAQVWLYAGEPEKAIDYLYAFANHAAPNRTWREEQALADTPSSEFYGDMPHNWASAEFVRLVRNLLVFETGEELHLLRGLPEKWHPATDNSLVLEATPTRYGHVDLEVTAAEDGYRLSFSRSDGNKTPGRLVLHWDGDVEAEGHPVERDEDDRWTVRGDRRELTVTLVQPGEQ